VQVVLLQEWQQPDGSAKHGIRFHHPTVEVDEDQQYDDHDHQKPGYIAKQLGDRQQDDSAAQRHQQGWKAEVTFVDRANVEQRTQEDARQERPDDANDNIGDQSLTAIGLHDQTGYPADHSAYDDPYNEIDHFLLLKLVPLFKWNAPCSVINDKCNLQLNAVFRDLSLIVQLDLLALNPGGLKIAERFLSTLHTDLDRIIKTFRGRHNDLTYFCYWHDIAPFFNLQRISFLLKTEIKICSNN
jgi:hypothetical protein